MQYTLVYGRTVILKRPIEAENEEEAMEKAIALENDDTLWNELHVTTSGESYLSSIEDDDTIWGLD